MKAGFNRWWLLPFGILTASALVALSIVFFQPAFVDHSFAEVAQRTSSGTVTDCSGARSSDYACFQERYQGLVRGSGVQAAFTDLKDQYDKNDFVKAQCHQMAHAIGRAAATVYGDDVSTTFKQGDSFCWSGYYHGAMETIVASTGPDEVVDKVNASSADLSRQEIESFDRYNLVHGLGHGFMGTENNELFQSLGMCDELDDDWEKESCYSGVFMENVMTQSNPYNPSKYLKADEPLYPCTDVEDKYKTECYKMQTSYALQTQDYDFSKVFDLCAGVDEDYRPLCYQSMGRDASGQSVSDVTRTRDTCMLGEDDEAKSNCIVGAVKDFVSYYHDDAQAKQLCGSLDDADMRDECLKEGEDYYHTTLQG